MSFSNWLASVAGNAQDMFSRIKDKGTFKRVVWASFLIGRADGTFDPAEKDALGALIQRKLPHFTLKDVLEVITEAEGLLSFSVSMGIMEILDEIGRAKGDEAKMIMNTACFIAGADGDFDDNEKNIARQICQRLGLDACSYGL